MFHRAEEKLATVRLLSELRRRAAVSHRSEDNAEQLPKLPIFSDSEANLEKPLAVVGSATADLK